MTSRSKPADKSATPGGDSPPGGAVADPVAEMVAEIATTDKAPPNAGGAIEQLALAPPPPVVQGVGNAPPVPRRGPGRPPGVKNRPGAPSLPPPGASAPQGRRRSLRERLAESEAEASALRSRVAMLTPNDAAIASAREALQGTFTIAGSLLASTVHPTLDITPHAAKLAELWAVPLAPHLGDIGDSMPWIAAGLGTVVVLLPVYQAYTVATRRTTGPDAAPPEEPFKFGVVEVHSTEDFPRPMGVV